jgi:hydrogenase maturation protease
MSGGVPRILVLGLGNPDRGDDAVGPLVARLLAGRLPPDVRVATRGGDMLALIEDWSDCDALVCIDAAAPAGMPGRLHRLDLAVDDLPRGPGPASSHGLGLAEAVALARALGRAPARIVVHAVEGACFDGGAPPTPAVAAAAEAVAARVVAEVARLRHGGAEVADA